MHVSDTVTVRSSAQAGALIAELERRAKTAEDIIVPAQSIRFELGEEPGSLPGTRPEAKAVIPFAGNDIVRAFGINRTGHAQTASKLNIPWQYYQRMASEAPDLLITSVNEWIGREGGNWLLRTLDGRVRANLSDGYRMLDNYDLAFATLGRAREFGAEIQRFTLTDDRFEMRLIARDWRGRAGIEGNGTGHTMRTGLRAEFIPGCYVSNSETGKGRLAIRPFILDAVCSNGYIGEQGFDRVHLGSRNDAGYISAETRAAKDKTIWMEIADVIGTVFNEERFKALVARMTDTAGQELAAPIAAVDAVVARYEMSDDDKQAILNELISPSHGRDPGRTVFGLISSITERAKTYEESDPERATAMEAAGMELVSIAPQLVEVRAR